MLKHQWEFRQSRLLWLVETVCTRDSFAIRTSLLSSIGSVNTSVLCHCLTAIYWSGGVLQLLFFLHTSLAWCELSPNDFCPWWKFRRPQEQSNNSGRVDFQSKLPFKFQRVKWGVQHRYHNDVMISTMYLTLSTSVTLIYKKKKKWGRVHAAVNQQKSILAAKWVCYSVFWQLFTLIFTQFLSMFHETHILLFHVKPLEALNNLTKGKLN